MHVIPFVHEGLGNSSYLVTLEDGRSLLIDPDRTAARYLRVVEERGWRITHVFETHVHADFITGAPEIAAATGARVFHSSEAGVAYKHEALRPGERVRLHGVEMEVIGSPGHSLEHVSYAMRTANREPMLFSGGALTAGGAARTDLVSPDMTGPLTRATFHTIREAFARLPDETLLYPTHGGGSFCSAGSTSERTSTLGRERETNPLLAVADEEEFANWFPTTFPAIPAYFKQMRPMNRGGPKLRREIAMPVPLAPEDFRDAAEKAVVVDVRPVEEYARLYIPGSLSDAFRNSYATWLGWLLPLEARLLFVLGNVPLGPVIDESLLVGFENFAGYLDGSVEAWEKAGLPASQGRSLDAAGVRRVASNGAVLVDVREPDEYASGHLDGALSIPLGQLQTNLERIPRDAPVVAYCGVGERSTTATSILERAGLTDVANLRGGIAAWHRSGQPLHM